MKNELELVTIVTDENGIESEVYVDRSNGRVYVGHEKGTFKATSIDGYGTIRHYDSGDFEDLKQGGNHGEILHHSRS